MEDAWKWIKEHPYLAGGGAAVSIVVVYFIWQAQSGGSSSNLTFNQQYALQRLQGNQQLQAMRIQNQPSLAQTQAGTRQTQIAATLQQRLAQITGNQGIHLANIQAFEYLQSLQTQEELAAMQQGAMPMTGPGGGWSGPGMGGWSPPPWWANFLTWLSERFGSAQGGGGTPGGAAPGGLPQRPA